jgi:hypothetical protein
MSILMNLISEPNPDYENSLIQSNPKQVPGNLYRNVTQSVFGCTKARGIVQYLHKELIWWILKCVLVEFCEDYGNRYCCVKAHNPLRGTRVRHALAQGPGRDGTGYANE